MIIAAYNCGFALLDIQFFWLWEILGRLHPLFVHFPVSLFVLAGLVELYALFTKKVAFIAIRNFLITVGAISAIISACLGLILASNEGLDSETLDFHKYGGLFLAALSIVLMLKQRLNIKPKYFRLLLFGAGISTIVTGHFGALLTHGESYFSELYPWNKSDQRIMNSQVLALTEGKLDEDEERKLVGEVRAIFAHNCYKCHSETKIKGELRLDEKEFVFTGGESGKVILVGNAVESELYRRITLPKNHKEAMPSKGKTLAEEEVAIIKLWIDKGAPWPDGLGAVNNFRVAELAPRNPSLPKGDFENPIDLWINDYLNKNKAGWSESVSDAIFIKRVYQDIIGLNPSYEELTAFEKEQSVGKRKDLVQSLLSNEDAYTQHWLTFWNDILRNDYTGTGYITKGRYAITDWLYSSIKNNKPYDVFVKQLLNPNEESRGFIEGIKWRGTVNASQRTEMQAAQNVSQVLLGLNLKCASCHDSFVSDWKLEDAYGFASIFAEEQLEIARCEKPIGKLAATRLLWPSLGTIDSTATRDEKLKQLSERIVQPANGRLARTIVNRIWKQLMGRGLVEPVDEMDNQPWNQDLLDWMAWNFVQDGYDIKKLIYLISTSKAYQLPSVSIEKQELLAGQNYHFQGPLKKRLSAEQFADAVSQFVAPVYTASDLKNKSLIDAGYTPISTSFTRASLVANNSFLTALGRPSREIVTTTRDSKASLLQALELTNGTKLDSVLGTGARKWAKSQTNSTALIDSLYKRAFARKPSSKEVAILSQKLGKLPKESDVQDVIWSMVLLPEFQFIY